MSLQALLLIIVLVLALAALLMHAAVDPWWGILALTVIMLLGAFNVYGRWRA